jgi:hypothetical protein
MYSVHIMAKLSIRTSGSPMVANGDEFVLIEFRTDFER